MDSKDNISGLCIVATPIGNFFDISLRALTILKEADYILCEDTRVTDKLLKFHNIKNSLKCYNEHSGPSQRSAILKDLTSGKKIALVSDAGTPLISDPGFQLVSLLASEGVKFTTIPGPCSVIAALTLSSFPTDAFSFCGFVPNKDSAREEICKKIKNATGTLIFFESPKRLCKTLRIFLEILGNVEIAIVREISKNFESVKKGPINEILEFYENEPPKGEIIILLNSQTFSKSEDLIELEIEELIDAILPHMSLRDISSSLSKITNLSKNAIYEKAAKLKNK